MLFPSQWRILQTVEADHLLEEKNVLFRTDGKLLNGVVLDFISKRGKTYRQLHWCPPWQFARDLASQRERERVVGITNIVFASYSVWFMCKVPKMSGLNLINKEKSLCACLCRCPDWFGARTGEPFEMRLGVKTPWDTRVLCTPQSVAK